MGHIRPSGLYGAYTKEENGTFSNLKSQKAAVVVISLQDTRILRILVRGEEGLRDIPEGIGEGYSNYYLVMKNRRF